VGGTNGDAGDDTNGTALATKGKSGGRATTTDKTNIKCYNCNKMGHYSNECLDKDKDTSRNSLGGGTNNGEERDSETGTQLLMAAVGSGDLDGYDSDFQQQGVMGRGRTYKDALMNASQTETSPSKSSRQVRFALKNDRSAKNGEATSSASVQHVLNQNRGKKVNRAWVLLDNQSTVDVFYNSRLLRNIRKSDRHMDIHCNAGVMSTSLVGDLPGYGEVWFHKNGIANILSLARVNEKYRVTYNSEGGNSFQVWKPDGTAREFHESPGGLYFLDVSAGWSGETVLVTTVDDKKSKYSQRDYSPAVLARKVHNMIGRPSLRDYLHYVDNGLIPNCPITRDDVRTAKDIFGPNKGCLKRKTV
jgi:hypothetical protein